MNPYKTIWLNPKQTFSEYIVKNKNQALFSIPLILMGVVFGFDIVNDVGILINGKTEPSTFLFSMLIGIGIAFLIGGLILPGLVNLTGKIWKGQSTMRQLVNVYSISSIPYSLILIYQVILLSTGQEPSTVSLNAGVLYILWIWSFGLLILGISIVQKFSYGLALLNIFISYLPILILGILRAT